MSRKPERDSLVILVGLASVMSGCSSHDDGEWRVCTDAWGRRLPDIACQQGSSYGGYSGHGGAGWVFISRSSSAPPVGQIVTGSSVHSATGTSYTAPAQGITRGGFGGSAEGGGAGHGAGE